MSGFTPASEGGGPNAVNAAPGFTVKARTTKKARHKDDQARITAHVRSVGRTGKARERERGYEEMEEQLVQTREQVPVVPKRETGEPEAGREHVRRDIGSHVVVFELGAQDNPEDLGGPFRDTQGTEMHWAARCITHDETRYFARHRAAIQAVRASHIWCEGCADAVASNRRIRHRARIRMKEATES